MEMDGSKKLINNRNPKTMIPAIPNKNKTMDAMDDLLSC